MRFRRKPSLGQAPRDYLECPEVVSETPVVSPDICIIQKRWKELVAEELALPL